MRGYFYQGKEVTVFVKQMGVAGKQNDLEVPLPGAEGGGPAGTWVM